MPICKKHIFTQHMNEIILLFHSGVTLLDIEKKYDMSRHTIKKYLKEIGVVRSKEEINRITQVKREESLFSKYGVTNISQIKDPEMQYRRTAGSRNNKRWCGKNNPNYKNKIGNTFGYKAFFRKDLNCYFRSSWEANYARILNFEKEKWVYEKDHFELSNETTYTPDFYLNNMNLYIEVKGYWRDDAKEKFLLFKKEYSKLKIKLIEEEQYKELINKYRYIVNNLEK